MPSVLVFRSNSPLYNNTRMAWDSGTTGWVAVVVEVVGVAAGVVEVVEPLSLEAAAVVAFEDEDYFARCRDQIIATRDWTTTELEKLGFKVLPSQANFVFTEPVGKNAAEVAQYLREQKILVRYFNKPRINQFLRITIGTDEQMQAMISALKAL